VTNQETPRHVEIKDEGDQTVAEAEVTTDRGPEGTVRTSMHAKDAYVRAGYRASLVDAVMDLPEVQATGCASGRTTRRRARRAPPPCSTRTYRRPASRPVSSTPASRLPTIRRRANSRPTVSSPARRDRLDRHLGLEL
jgi:hypothetical protein